MTEPNPIPPHVREALQARAVLVEAGWDHDRVMVSAVGEDGDPWNVVVNVKMPDGMRPAPWVGVWSGLDCPGIQSVLDELSQGFDAFAVMLDEDRLAVLADTALAAEPSNHARLVSAFAPIAQQEQRWMAAQAKRNAKAAKQQERQRRHRRS